MFERPSRDALHRLVNGYSGVALFPVASAFPRERTLVWNGDDPRAFLEAHKRLGGGLLYLREPHAEDEVSTPGAMELAFLHDGVFHVYEWGMTALSNLHGGGIHEVGLGHLAPGRAIGAVDVRSPGIPDL